MKYIFISDVHMNGHDAVYSWLPPAGVQRLADFLNSDEAASADKLFLVGDLLDLWVYPIDIVPSTAAEVISAPHNAPAIDALRAFKGQVVYLPGNHDAGVTHDQARLIRDDIVFGPRYAEGPLRVRHGHEGSLFNAPDPSGHGHPFGYWLTRCSATGTARGLGINMNLWTILGNAKKVIAALQGKSLSECVFDTVLEACGLTTEDWCVESPVLSVGLSFIRAQYENLIDAWTSAGRGSAIDAVLAEWDPYYDLPVGAPLMHVVGHSHNRLVSQHPSYGAYLNTGCCCGTGPASFVRVWDEDETLCGQVVDFDGTESAVVRV